MVRIGVVNVSGSKATSFTYDANGNMTGDSWGSAFTYNERNRAVSVKHRNSSVGAQTASVATDATKLTLQGLFHRP